MLEVPCDALRQALNDDSHEYAAPVLNQIASG